jgi:hypothetical protein
MLFSIRYVKQYEEQAAAQAGTFGFIPLESAGLLFFDA